MKKTVSTLIIISMLLSLVLAIIPASADGGEAINSAEELLSMKADGNYYLNADLTLSGSYTNDFRGTLDGKGHTITLDGTPSLFKCISGGSVSNLNLSVRSSLSSSADVGALARVAKGSFEGISAEVSYTILSGAGAFKHALGGIIGRINGASTVKNCVSLGEITVNTSITSGGSIRYGVGGIIGVVAEAGAVEISDCVNNAKISSKQYMTSNGGIIGIFYGNTQISVTDSQNYGEILGTSGNHSGTAGICGVADGTHTPSSEAIFDGCRNYAKISDQRRGDTASSHHMGGIVGRSYGMPSITFCDCVNSGEIASVGGGWAAIGGIFGGDMTHGYDWSGDHAGTVSVINCVNFGNIHGGVFVGGIGGGILQHSVDDCMVILKGCSNFGDISSNAQAGGIIGECGEEGFNGLNASDCYNAGNVKATANAGGIIGYILNEDGNSYNKITEYLPIVIDNCLNTGEIVSTGSAAIKFTYTAAGILGNTTREVTIKNSVNTGAVRRERDNASSIAQIAPEHNVKNKAEGNLCYDVRPFANAYVSAADKATVDAAAERIIELASADLRVIEALIVTSESYKEHLVMSGWDEMIAAVEETREALNRAASKPEADLIYEKLYSAIDNIRLLGAPDETKLGGLIAEAKLYFEKENEYTSQSWTAFRLAYETAVKIKALDRPTQLEVNNADKALNKAIFDLEIRADMELLRAEIAKRQEVVLGDIYTKKGMKAFRSALKKLEELSERADLADWEMELAMSEMQEAEKQLMLKVAVTDIEEAVKNAEENYPRENYTQSSYYYLRVALQNARRVIAEDDANALEVSNTLAAIDGALFKLEERGDARLLNEAVAAVPNLEYTAESLLALNSVVEQIRLACDNEKVGNLSKAKVEELLASLESAVAGLEESADEKPPKTDGNKNDGTGTDDAGEGGCASYLGTASVILIGFAAIGFAFVSDRFVKGGGKEE